MTPIETYLANAAAERAAAARASLPNRRAIHERSAATWEEMAGRVSETAELTLANETAKAMR